MSILKTGGIIIVISRSDFLQWWGMTRKHFADQSSCCHSGISTLGIQVQVSHSLKIHKGSRDAARGYAARPFCSHAILKKLSYTSPFCGFNQRAIGGCSGASPAFSLFSVLPRTFVLRSTGSHAKLLAQFPRLSFHYNSKIVIFEAKQKN